MSVTDEIIQDNPAIELPDETISFNIMGRFLQKKC